MYARNGDHVTKISSKTLIIKGPIQDTIQLSINCSNGLQNYRSYFLVDKKKQIVTRYTIEKLVCFVLS